MLRQLLAHPEAVGAGGGLNRCVRASVDAILNIKRVGVNGTVHGTVHGHVHVC
jgi:hypothetical protein